MFDMVRNTLPNPAQNCQKQHKKPESFDELKKKQ